MNPLLSEINEIPQRASEFLRLSPHFTLPLRVPYLGMDSSYFAPLAFKYMGVNIFPELASEYFNYIQTGGEKNKAVIISQSGLSSEALWCAELFTEYVAITNNSNCSLSQNPNVSEAISLFAVIEQYSSSKTYINTLLALFKGFGFNIEQAAGTLKEKISIYRQQGEKMAKEGPMNVPGISPRPFLMPGQWFLPLKSLRLKRTSRFFITLFHSTIWQPIWPRC